MSSWRILYVDDDPDMREIAAMALELEPAFEVKACASGAEALQVAPEWRPDLLMLDVVMPDMDGPATLAALRVSEAGASLPAIFITARAHQEESERLLALGAFAVIAKPFNPMTLARIVKGHLEER